MARNGMMNDGYLLMWVKKVCIEMIANARRGGQPLSDGEQKALRGWGTGVPKDNFDLGTRP